MGFLHRQAQHDTRSNIYQVDFQHFAYKREGTRRTEVALDNFDLVLSCQILDIKRSGDIQLPGYLSGDTFDSADSLDIQFLRREHDGRVAGVHAGILHMLGDRISDDLAVARHSIHLDLFGIGHEFGDHHRVLLRHIRREGKELMQLLVVGADVHRCAGEHI